MSQMILLPKIIQKTRNQTVSLRNQSVVADLRDQGEAIGLTGMGSRQTGGEFGTQRFTTLKAYPILNSPNDSADSFFVFKLDGSGVQNNCLAHTKWFFGNNKCTVLADIFSDALKCRMLVNGHFYRIVIRKPEVSSLFSNLSHSRFPSTLVLIML